MSKVHVAVLGAGWWAQGWHLPHLWANPQVELIAIVDTNPHPQSPLNPAGLESLAALGDKYQCRTYHSIELMLQHEPCLDGVVVSTPHATHYRIAITILDSCLQRLKTAKQATYDIRMAKRDDDPNLAGTRFPLLYRPIHIFMEKPMTTCQQEALALWEAYQSYQHQGGMGVFLINHSANYRPQTQIAYDCIRVKQRLGAIQHVTAFFASPLRHLFDDPQNTSWNEPTGTMLGNGFAWGQQTHLVAWLLYVTGLQPQEVSCFMTHSLRTGADIAHACSMRCCATVPPIDTSLDDSASHDLNSISTGTSTTTATTTVSLSGTCLLPGDSHDEKPMSKRVIIEIFGSHGILQYSGNDLDPSSGRMEYIPVAGHINNGHTDRMNGSSRGGGDDDNDDGDDEDGRTAATTSMSSSEVLCDTFAFEEFSPRGIGPASLQNWIAACQSQPFTAGADISLGLLTVQTVAAMYESHVKQTSVTILVQDLKNR